MPTTENNHIKALIELLDGETGPRAETLRQELAHVIKEQPQELHEVIERDFHSSVPAALVCAMEEVCWEELAGACARFSGKINPDLEEGLAIVSRFVNPAVSRDEITNHLDSFCIMLRPLLANCTGPAEISNTLSRFFFRAQSFTVLPSAHDIKDVSFGRFAQKKQGSALCMACLYAVIGSRFGLDSGVVDMAGRILACFTPDNGEEMLFSDPADQGKLLSLNDCKDYIYSRNLEWSDAFAMPLSSRALLRRFLANMIFILNKLRDERRLSYLRRYMDILKN